MAKSKSGDSYNRNFVGGVAQCGCEWVHKNGFQFLSECTIHALATKISVKKFIRAALGDDRKEIED